MGVLKDRLQEQINFFEGELVRIDADAAAAKARLQVQLATLRKADQVLTPELEALIADLQRAGIYIIK